MGTFRRKPVLSQQLSIISSIDELQQHKSLYRYNVSVQATCTNLESAWIYHYTLSWLFLHDGRRNLLHVWIPRIAVNTRTINISTRRRSGARQWIGKKTRFISGITYIKLGVNESTSWTVSQIPPDTWLTITRPGRWPRGRIIRAYHYSNHLMKV